MLEILSEPAPREQLKHVNSIEDAKRLIQECKNIIVLTGAGVYFKLFISVPFDSMELVFCTEKFFVPSLISVSYLNIQQQPKSIYLSAYVPENLIKKPNPNFFV